MLVVVALLKEKGFENDNNFPTKDLLDFNVVLSSSSLLLLLLLLSSSSLSSSSSSSTSSSSIISFNDGNDDFDVKNDFEL